MQIPAVEDRIVEGFQSRFLTQFGCDIVISQVADQIKQLQLRAQGKPVEYPFAYAKMSTLSSSENSDMYASRYLMRKGVTVTPPNSNVAYNIRLLPTQFDLEVTYETNRASGENSVTWFIKRWLMSARMGLLKFRIPIGNLMINIGVQQDLNVSVPNDRQSPSEGETGYKVVANVQIKGYMSEIQAKPVASSKVQEVRFSAGTEDGETLFIEDMKSNG